jgi:hypothetical protein
VLRYIRGEARRRLAVSSRAVVACRVGSAGPVSDLSEVLVMGCEPAALDVGVAPACPTGPAPVEVSASCPHTEKVRVSQTQARIDPCRRARPQSRLDRFDPHWRPRKRHCRRSPGSAMTGHSLGQPSEPTRLCVSGMLGGPDGPDAAMPSAVLEGPATSRGFVPRRSQRCSPSAR